MSRVFINYKRNQSWKGKYNLLILFFLNAFIPKKGWLKGAKQSAHPKTIKKNCVKFCTNAKSKNGL
jgi:hypothetical protein